MPRCEALRSVKWAGAVHPVGADLFLPPEVVAAMPAGTVRVIDDPTSAEPPALKTDGPTLEEFVKAGYKAEDYPPAGYAEKPSHGLAAYRESLLAGSTPATAEQVATG